jgi:rhamnulokinase
VTAALAAVDLGASSGRVVVGEVDSNNLRLTEIHRFANEAVSQPDGLHWDIRRLYGEILVGLREAQRRFGPLVSIGIDTWAVDYGLLDDSGALLGDPFHYRDARNAVGVATVERLISPSDLYSRNGLQFLQFNTIYQLAADKAGGRLDEASTLLLIPDLLGYWLTGERFGEVTNSSTTGLLGVHTRTWDTDLIDVAGLPRHLFAELGAPGEMVGAVPPEISHKTGVATGTSVTLVGTHDTASAVVGVPAESDDFAYISCGTWALVGLELQAPVVSEAARLARFTNEAGVDGRTRFLHNVTGLWLLQESIRTWHDQGIDVSLDELLAAAAAVPAGGPVVDPDAEVFLPPGDMPARIEAACRIGDMAPPDTRPALVRCILDSLSLAFARTVRDAERLAERKVSVVHIVGGGSRNDLLCQLTANACGLPVRAGPVEATAIGNIVVQARAHGLIGGSLEDIRGLILRTQVVTRFEPVSSLSRAG